MMRLMRKTAANDSFGVMDPRFFGSKLRFLRKFWTLLIKFGPIWTPFVQDHADLREKWSQIDKKWHKFSIFEKLMIFCDFLGGNNKGV